jgi:hypothetical protein
MARRGTCSLGLTVACRGIVQERVAPVPKLGKNQRLTVRLTGVSYSRKLEKPASERVQVITSRCPACARS